MLNARSVGQYLFDLCCNIVRALKRRGSWKLSVYVEVTLILIGEKTLGDFAAEPGGGASKTCKQN